MLCVINKLSYYYKLTVLYFKKCLFIKNREIKQKLKRQQQWTLNESE